MALDDCIQWIISLVERETRTRSGSRLLKRMPTWPRLTTYEAPRRDAALRIELPRTPQADQVLQAIDKHSSEDVT